MRKSENIKLAMQKLMKSPRTSSYRKKMYSFALLCNVNKSNTMIKCTPLYGSYEISINTFIESFNIKYEYTITI